MGRGGRGRRGGGQRPQPALRAEQGPQDQRLLPLIRGRELDLGDVSGEHYEPVMATFTYFGHRFRVNPDLNEVMVMDLLEDAGDVDVDDPAQLAVAKGYVRQHIHEDDFDALWDVAHQNRQGVYDVMRLCNKLLELVTERPTTPPSDSSGGRPEIRQNSQGGASVRDVAKPFIDRYEEGGRPDLAAQVALAVEAREARGLATV